MICEVYHHNPEHINLSQQLHVHACCVRACVCVHVCVCVNVGQKNCGAGRGWFLVDEADCWSRMGRRVEYLADAQPLGLHVIHKVLDGIAVG